MHRLLNVDERLIHRWATGNRPVSENWSDRIVRIVRAKHNSRAARDEAFYASMVEAIVEPEARDLLLEIVSKEVEVRAAVIAKLARSRSRLP